jgi:hypothetical protein
MYLLQQFFTISAYETKERRKNFVFERYNFNFNIIIMKKIHARMYQLKKNQLSFGRQNIVLLTFLAKRQIRVEIKQQYEV